MEGFTLIDGIVLIVIVLSAILAWSRGFVREALAIAGWIGAAIVAFLFAPTIEPLMQEIPYVSDYLAGSCELSMIVAFGVIIAIALIVLSIFVPLFSGAIQNSAIGGLDRGLGFLFGIARGILLVVIALIVYERVITSDPIAIVDNSRTIQIFAGSQDSVNALIPEDAPQWLVGRYEDLINACDGRPLENGTPAETAPAETAPGTDPAIEPSADDA